MRYEELKDTKRGFIHTRVEWTFSVTLCVCVCACGRDVTTQKCLEVVSDTWQFQTTGLTGKKKVSFFPAAAKKSGGNWAVLLPLAYACPSSFAFHWLIQIYRSERKCQTPQVAGENRMTKFVKLQMLQRVLHLTRGSVLVSSCQEKRKEKRLADRQKTICRRCQTLTNKHLWHFFCTHCNVRSSIFV